MSVQYWFDATKILDLSYVILISSIILKKMLRCILKLPGRPYAIPYKFRGERRINFNYELYSLKVSVISASFSDS
jgi:hypothetical protein